jgi:hypothetical protein
MFGPSFQGRRSFLQTLNAIASTSAQNHIAVERAADRGNPDAQTLFHLHNGLAELHC